VRRHTRLTRRSMATGLAAGALVAALPATPARATRALDGRRGFLNDQALGLPYLERTGREQAGRDDRPFIAPSRIHPAYSHALYVNCAVRGPGAQKMWAIQRDGPLWRLAMWDNGFWKDEDPCYSWPVSTGRVYPGDRRAGPPPIGVYNVDERPGRHVRGWGSAGMYNSIFIDYHYSSGRRSGVAIHGTTASKYHLLGRADSHGCVRLTKANADQLWTFFHPGTRPGPASPLWSDHVPRYFSSPLGNSIRRNYRRDGEGIETASGLLTRPGYTVLLVFFRDD